MNPYIKGGLGCTCGLICGAAAIGNAYNNDKGTATLTALLSAGFFGYGIQQLWMGIPDEQAQFVASDWEMFDSKDFPPGASPKTPLCDHRRDEAQSGGSRLDPQPAIAKEENSIPTTSPQPQQDNLDFLLHELRVWVVGMEQGSGKTSLLDWLIAEHLKLGHQVEFVNAFAPYSEYKGVPVWGKGDKYDEAAKGIAAFCLEVHRRLRLRGRRPGYDPLVHERRYFLALDEVTEYEQFMPEAIALSKAFDQSQLEHFLEGMEPSERRERLSKPFEVMPEFFSTIGNRIRQANAAIAYASHGTTQAQSGGAAGLRGKSESAFKSSYRVYRYAMTDPSAPSGKRPQEWGDFYPPHATEPLRLAIGPQHQAPNPYKDFSGLAPAPSVLSATPSPPETLHIRELDNFPPQSKVISFSQRHQELR